MTVSIIIAVKTWQKNLEECAAKCRELDFSDFEILILPDNPIGEGLFPEAIPATNEVKRRRVVVPVQVIPTGPVSPAHKRDIALRHARGQILAFIDDDAYPQVNWLKNAVENFKDSEIAAVGGPAVTPEGDNIMQKASGRVYESFLVSGPYRYRYIPAGRIFVDDYPSCNLFLRKSLMQELGGFDTKFWPGEDTKLCREITKKMKKKIIYDPGVLVYHHRRPLFMPHLKQIANYALHRGYFVKRYPQTSLKPAYFLPTIFLSAVIAGGIISRFFIPFRAAYLTGLCLYLSLVFVFSISKELSLIPLVFFGTILTHFTYGLFFLKGLCSKSLKEEL